MNIDLKGYFTYILYYECPYSQYEENSRNALSLRLSSYLQNLGFVEACKHVRSRTALTLTVYTYLEV